MRFENDGQVIIGGTTPNYATDLFTVFGNATQNAAISAYSPRTGFQTTGGRYGILSTVDTANGFALYCRNLDALGYGIVTAGSGYTSVGLIASHTAGIHAQGYDGLHAWGKDANGYGIFAMGSAAAGPYNISGRSAGISAVANDGMHARGSNASGRGIIAVGSGQSVPSISNDSEGGAFTGYHGVFAKGVNAQGIGVIGIGSNGATYSTISGGLGGTFSGNYGIYGKGLAAEGVGVVGVGSAGSGYYTVTGGSGGTFAGYHGLLSVGVNATNGIGVVGAGNNGSYNIIPGGAGGCFTATYAGAAGFAQDGSAGIGIIGAGNNQAAIILAAGCGGDFTGSVCGVHGYAVNSSNDRYGGYFATGGSLYAYVGGRYSGTNRKIVGTGTVSTIVKNRSGERITLTCPEAPETVFQDFGTGQLVEGFAHISIDPDLAINITVNGNHPLKVYITPEGDCNGVYVTNKSANGFDVIELQGGKSNVQFSWQIVATRANEEYTLEDGTKESSDYSQRFQPAPGPMESIKQPVNSMNLKNAFNVDQTLEIKTLKTNDDPIIDASENPNE
jgi:hypothetical protein